MINEIKDMTRQKTLLTLPEDAASTLKNIDNRETRDAYLAALRAQGWTLQSLAEASDITRERVRQLVKTQSALDNSQLVADLPLPVPPEAKESISRTPVVYTEPNPDTLARLLELKEDAQKARGRESKYYPESEEYTRLIVKSIEEDGVKAYRLAKRLGVTNSAIRSRLIRHGHKTPAWGTSRSYTPIK